MTLDGPWCQLQSVQLYAALDGPGHLTVPQFSLIGRVEIRAPFQRLN